MVVNAYESIIKSAYHRLRYDINSLWANVGYNPLSIIPKLFGAKAWITAQYWHTCHPKNRTWILCESRMLRGINFPQTVCETTQHKKSACLVNKRIVPDSAFTRCIDCLMNDGNCCILQDVAVLSANDHRVVL